MAILKNHIGVVKSVGTIAVGLILMILIIAWMSGMFNKKIAPGETTVSATKATDVQLKNVDEVHEIFQPYFEEAVGTLKASSRTEISARVMAPIIRIAVRAGQRVKEGDVLVELDDRDFQSQLSQAKTSVAAAEASLSEAEKNYERSKKLLVNNSISHSEMDQATAKYEVAKAKRNEAKDSVTRAEVAVSYTKITAPRSGIIVDRLVDQGGMAQPGAPLLVLYDPDSLRLEAPVMENLAGKLEIGQKAIVHIDSLDEDVEGTIDERVPQAEAASRSFLVKVALPKKPGMYEGMFGRLKIPAGDRRFLCLNTAAVERVGQLEFVNVIRDDGTIERRFITTGRVGRPGRVEVLSGLSSKEKVLLKAE